MTDNIDGLDDLYERLNRKRSGWHWQINSETGATALFPSVPVYAANSPEQRALEDAWEARAIQMHENQEAIRLAAKPKENAMTRITRGD